MPIAEDSAGGSPVPIPTNLTTNLTGEATGSGTLDYTTGDIDIAVTVVDNGHNHILSNITDVQVNNAISGQILVYNGTVWANATNTSGITAIVQDLTPQLGGNLDLNGKNINGNGNINLADNYKLTLGTGNDLEISHDGVSSYIRDVGAGDLQIFASDDVYIRGQGSNTYMARFNESGAVTLYHNNVIRLITTDSGITVTDEVEAAEFIGPLRGPTKFKGQAGEALSAGDPVYISGISGNTTVVSKADANDASKMPAFGIIDASVSANASCQVLTFGEMHNLDTSAFSEGDELYVSNTGTLTTAIPSGESSQIQKIAKVTRSHASVGGIFIMGAGRSNAVPNLDNGDIFIGDGTNHATTTSLNTAVNALTLTNYLPLSGGAMTGNITTSGTFDGRDVSVDGAKLDGIATGADVTLNEISAGTNVTISAGGVISSTASGGLAHVVDDTTPQLGGNLSLNSHDITGTGNLNFTGSVTLSGTVDGRDVAADGTKLDGIEASADVTDTANVTAAGALMDSEVTNLAQVKAFDSSDYATAAQGTTADAALPTTGGTMTGDILFNDNVKAKYGTSSDLEIYHDTNNSWIREVGTGNLNIGGDNEVRIMGNSGGEFMARFIANGNVNLYHNSNLKLQTISTGIAVTGGIDVTGAVSINASSAPTWDTDTHFWAESGFGVRYDGYQHRWDVGLTRTEAMRIDSSGNVGIATSAPSTKIEVNGDIGIGRVAGAYTFREVVGGSERAGMHSNASNELIFKTGAATERMRLTSSGIDVTGKGTYTGAGSFEALELKTTDANRVYVTGNSTTSGDMWRLGTSTSNANLNIDALQSNGQILLRTGGTTERMRIDASGNVGIGTSTTNNNKAVIEGGVAATNGSSLALKSGSGTSSRVADLAFYGTFVSHPDTGQRRTADITSGYSTGNWGTEYLAFGVGTGGSNDSAVVTTERMRIDSGGIDVTGTIKSNGSGYNPSNTGWATNASLITSGSYGGGLTFLDGSAGYSIRVENSGADLVIGQGATSGALTQKVKINSSGLDVTGDLTVSSTIEVGSLTPAQDGAIEVGVIALGTPAISSTTDSTSLRNHIIFDNPNGAVGKINTLNSATSYLTSSDYRLKTDVQEMTGSIDRVKALRPVNFEWIVDGTRVDGFLAHEAQEVVPEAVDGEKDAMRDQQYVESEATGDIYTPAVEATYETIQVELTPAVEATYDEDGNELTPAVDATYEEQQQELTPAIDEVIHSTDVVEPDELEEGQRWRETTEKVMATRQVPDYQGIDQSKIVPLLTSALQDAIAKIEALETRLEALES